MLYVAYLFFLASIPRSGKVKVKLQHSPIKEALEAMLSPIIPLLVDDFKCHGFIGRAPLEYY